MPLNQPTLVLNRSWVAIDVTTVKHAVVMLYSGVARAMHVTDFSVHDFESWCRREIELEDAAVRSISVTIPLPEVIVLTRYAGFPKRTAAFTRRNLFRRDGYSCQYCGAMPKLQELTIDHVIPRSKSGASSWENCVLACKPCNKRKGNRKAEEVGLRLQRRPFRPAWSPHLLLGQARPNPSWAPFIKGSSLDL